MAAWLTRLKRWLTAGDEDVVVVGGGASQATPVWHVEYRDDCTVYTGAFAIYDDRGRLFRQVQGRVVEWPGLPAEVYLRNPPPELRRHHHGACLQLVAPGSSWFKLHWERPARDFDPCRAYVEQMLDEAFQDGR